MNPFAMLLDQSSALSAHAERLTHLPSRVFQQLSKPPRVLPDELTARFDALIDSQEANKEARDGQRAARRRSVEWSTV